MANTALTVTAKNEDGTKIDIVAKFQSGRRLLVRKEVRNVKVALAHELAEALRRLPHCDFSLLDIKFK